MVHHFFTSESVTEGHPDKICDQISDAILNEILTQDPYARVACETTCTTGMVQVMGEISTSCYVDIPKVVRDTVREIGYDRAKYGFDCDTCAVLTAIDEQSADIALGVDNSLERKEGASESDLAIGAGDQGMMFDYLRPDGKSQVTVEYDEDNQPVRVDTVVISTQHSPEVSLAQIREDMIEQVVKKVIPSHLLDENTKYFINPTGRFVIGGPHGDSGLTGRKIIVDTYGGIGRHGGGAFSGKDPTKVDRSGAYAARWVAKNIVAAGLAKRCEIQLAYAIGVAEPVSIMVETFGTGVVGDDVLEKAVEKVFDLRPAAIIEQLDLRKPIYKQLAAYGHMGREELGVKWENTDKVEALKAAVNG